MPAPIVVGALTGAGSWGIKKLFQWIEGKIGRKLEDNEKEDLLGFHKEYTKRLMIDMKSDSWLSKNVRPITLLTIVFSFPIFAIYAPESELVIETYRWWGTAGIGFYFGSKLFERVAEKWQR